MRPYRVVASFDEIGILHHIQDASGRVLSVDEWAVLAETPDPGTMSRHVDFILTDESQPKHRKPVLSPHCLTFPTFPPLMFLDSELAIGVVDEVLICPPGSMAGVHVEGACALATATLRPTVLGTIAWQALHEKLFTSVCLHGDGQLDEAGALLSCVARFVVLGSSEGNCIANARVIRLREIPKGDQTTRNG